MAKARGGQQIRRDEEIVRGIIMELQIYNQEERLLVAQILIKNGYTVSQGKRTRGNGKTVDYFLNIERAEDPVVTR